MHSETRRGRYADPAWTIDKLQRIVAYWSGTVCNTICHCHSHREVTL